MPVTYTAAMLKGRTVRAFSMLGKPCVGAEYAGNGDAHRLEGRLDEELYKNDERLFAMGRYIVEVGGGEKEVRPC